MCLNLFFFNYPLNPSHFNLPIGAWEFTHIQLSKQKKYFFRLVASTQPGRWPQHKLVTQKHKNITDSDLQSVVEEWTQVFMASQTRRSNRSTGSLYNKTRLTDGFLFLKVCSTTHTHDVVVRSVSRFIARELPWSSLAQDRHSTSLAHLLVQSRTEFGRHRGTNTDTHTRAFLSFFFPRKRESLISCASVML